MTVLHWSPEEVRLKAHSLSGRGKSTTVKIELEVANPWALASLIDQLTEAKRATVPQRVARPAPGPRQ